MIHNMQGIKSEMKKLGDPNKHNSLSRTAYYTGIKFIIDGNEVKIASKVDTGASYTVFGLKNKVLKPFINGVLNSKMNAMAYDASDKPLNLYGYVVNDFRLTENILIPKIKVYFSEDIGEKAVLGMDILSLFDFQYLIEKGSSQGTFWINNYIDALDRMKKRVFNKGIDYVDPVNIYSIDDTEQQKR